MKSCAKLHREGNEKNRHQFGLTEPRVIKKEEKKMNQTEEVRGVDKIQNNRAFGAYYVHKR